MPARVVLPRSLANFARAADNPKDDGPSVPLDLEAKLRRAALEALSTDDGAGIPCNGDLLEALACQACEVLEGIEQCNDEASLSAAKEALHEGLDSLLAEAGVEAPGRFFDALLEAAELLPAAGSGAEELQLPSELKLPGLLPARRGARAKSEATEATQSPVEKSAGDELDTATDAVADKDKAAQVDEQGPRFQRRGDKAQAKAVEYLREQADEFKRVTDETRARERELATFLRWPARASVSQKDETASNNIVGPVQQPASSDSEDDEEDEETRDEREATKRRLRELGEPVTFFGESDADRWKRLQRSELSRDQDVLAGGSTNVMQILDRRQKREREAAGGIERGPDIVDAEDAEFTAVEGKMARRAGVGISDSTGDGVATADDAPEDSDSDDEGAGAQAAAVGLGEEERDLEAEEAQQKLDAASHAVMSWIRSVLRAWEAALTERAPAEEKHAAFKTEKAQYRQSKQYLKPLRRSLRDGEVDPGVIFSLAQIAELSEKRHYRFAKEAYMRLAIGNQAWPMGVTFVTFHDRANRHRIGEGKHAHVLDDETTRKYVQMVKRLLTFAEQHWPLDPTLAE